MYHNAIAERLTNSSPEWLRRTLFVSAAGRISYGEARETALAYAGWLAESEGIRPGDRVALCLPKTLEAVLVIYGILAVGAAYVPLQFLGPSVRLRTILTSLRPQLFITTGDMAARLHAAGPADLPAIRTIEVPDGEEALAGLRRGVAPKRAIAEVSPQGVAAIFFTSGSTGEPKGVMWSHRSMAAAVAALPRWRGQRADDRLISVPGLHYSASCEIFYPNFSGASIYLCGDQEILIAKHIARTVECERTTIWSSTATGLRMLVEGGSLPARELSALRRVEVYGERMPIAALHAAMEALPHAQFHNLYAATEAFDMIEYDIPRPLNRELSEIPLGRPSPNYELSLRDEMGRAVKPGEVGEICVVGPAVTIGYWNDPVLSAAKRLSDTPDSYRTGDLAVLGADGLLRLVGRKDHVVKLRGHRFDLGEIEAVAKLEPRVREAVAFTCGGPMEAAGVVLAVLADEAADGRTDLEDRLRRLCMQRLPGFARPSRIVRLSEFPLLSSGKIDRRALERLITA